MKIIFSPTKTMAYSEIKGTTTPVFLSKAQSIIDSLQKMSDIELKKVWRVNDKLFSKTKELLFNSDFKHTSMALYSYQGLAFTYLNPRSLDETALSYLEANLRILSGLYGVVKPTDGIINYRLEMNYAKIYWQNDLSTYFNPEEIIINLASSEYASLLAKKNLKIIDVIFYKDKNGTLKQEATEAKMLRGLFLNYMANKQIETVAEMKEFALNGYLYSEAHSNDNKLVFIKKIDL